MTEKIDVSEAVKLAEIHAAGIACERHESLGGRADGNSNLMLWNSDAQLICCLPLSQILAQKDALLGIADPERAIREAREALEAAADVRTDTRHAVAAKARAALALLSPKDPEEKA